MGAIYRRPGWAGSVELIVELGIPSADSSASLWSTALFDTATWGSDYTWTDVSDDLRSLTTKRTSSRESGAYNVGTATIVLDNSSWAYSEENSSGPFYGGIHSGIPVRARAVITFADGTVLPLPIFWGTVGTWDDSYPIAGTNSVVTITASDGFETIAAFNGYEQTAAGAGELAGVRMHRILDNAGWTGGRAIDAGSVAMQATTLAQNALTELRLVADSEGGKLWMEPDNTVWFTSRYALLEDTRSNTVQVTFTDVDGSTDGPRYSAPDITSSRDLQRSIVAYARTGGTSQVAADPETRALIGDRQLSRTDLIAVDDPSVLSLAQRDLNLRMYAERRVDQLAYEPLVQADAVLETGLRWLAHSKLWDLARVKRTPDGAPFDIDRYVFVSGLSHTFGSAGPSAWRITVDFQSATQWRTFVSSLFDVATFDSAELTW